VQRVDVVPSGELVGVVVVIIVVIVIVSAVGVFGAPIHQLRHIVDAIGAVFARFVKSKISVNGVVLFAEIALPIELVPSQVTAIFPFVFLAPVRIEIAHSVVRKLSPRQTETQIEIPLRLAGAA